MKLAIVPRAAAANKPPHGSPCNSCGVCCMVAQCDLSVLMFGDVGAPCPALERDGDRHVCGVITDPRQFVAISVSEVSSVQLAARTIIREGVGCDARINGEPINAAFNARLDAEEDPHLRRAALNFMSTLKSRVR